MLNEMFWAAGVAVVAQCYAIRGLEVVAAQNISSTITNLFNRHAGTSFYKFVTSLRLAEAKNLMAEGMPMEKIALRVGFGDYSTFYRAFKKEFSISPRQFLQSIEK